MGRSGDAPRARHDSALAVFKEDEEAVQRPCWLGISDPQWHLPPFGTSTADCNLRFQSHTPSYSKRLGSLRTTPTTAPPLTTRLAPRSSRAVSTASRCSPASTPTSPTQRSLVSPSPPLPTLPTPPADLEIHLDPASPTFPPILVSINFSVITRSPMQTS